ncbi:PREDICTED: probable transmembrane ascorbate ferrireductase 3 [Fragaria vesca subsp. vesca]|uniref:probable transmembrane ascorbate ferrireductase 3 n=1 Tax=Fragaria vesca subsp. vesca TaxID=101020 RepID=UPI0002C2FB87|nr:PREDICTED: probable transmembrane ascorbate ferrireductase 3 [Fragaria vesca subsp. vesca]
MYTSTNYRYQRSASRLTIGAHLFGILALILLLVWLLHYRGGLDYDSGNSQQVFNVHPFLMFFGFIFLAGEAMMAYKTVMAQHKVQKYVHGFFHLVALCCGIWGICAVFRFHDMEKLDDMYSIHSWIGLTTIILYGLQWLIGFATFLFPRASEQSRAQIAPWHMSLGRVLLYLSICAALTGLMEKSTFLRTGGQISERELHLINFTALSILLFGIFVDLSVALARYV